MFKRSLALAFCVSLLAVASAFALAEAAQLLLERLRTPLQGSDFRAVAANRLLQMKGSATQLFASDAGDFAF